MITDDDILGEFVGEREDIEQAAGIRLGACPSCQHPHLFLVDENGDAFAEVVLDQDVLRELVAAIKTLVSGGGNGDDRETKQ